MRDSQLMYYSVTPNLEKEMRTYLVLNNSKHATCHIHTHVRVKSEEN